MEEILRKELMDKLGCTDKDNIKKCYYKLALQFHPDRTGGSDEKFKEVQNAYELLNNEEKFKKELDERLLLSEKEDNNLQKKLKIMAFLDANDCDYEKDKTLDYYTAIFIDLYKKIFYLLDYEWHMVGDYPFVNYRLFHNLMSDIEREKTHIRQLCDLDPYQLNIQALYTKVFFIHTMEERIYSNPEMDNDELVNNLRFFEYFMEKNPSWTILN